MNTVLAQMQSLVANINDVPVTHNVNQFLITRSCAAVTDEQVLVSSTEEGTELGVYVDPEVLLRLQNCNPFEQLCDINLADFCTALEGVSHFQYLIWCVEHSRSVSLLELELQAEVDKYAVAMWLLLKQTHGWFPHALHARMFTQVSYALQLDQFSLQRYQEANHCAARYCQTIDSRFLRCRQRRMDQWLSELQIFYRCSHRAKLRRSIH